MAKEKRVVDQGVTSSGRPVQPALQSHGLKYTGTVYALVHKPHEGFANFGIVTLKLKDGVIVATDISQPYNGLEALAKLDILNDKALEALRKTYPPEYQRCG